MSCGLEGRLDLHPAGRHLLSWGSQLRLSRRNSAFSGRGPEDTPGGHHETIEALDFCTTVDCGHAAPWLQRELTDRAGET